MRACPCGARRQLKPLPRSARCYTLPLQAFMTFLAMPQPQELDQDPRIKTPIAIDNFSSTIPGASTVPAFGLSHRLGMACRFRRVVYRLGLVGLLHGILGTLARNPKGSAWVD